MQLFKWTQKIGLLAAFLLLPLSASARTFSDVPTHHKNHVAIDQLSDRGLISGYNDGRFAPNQTINRAEAIKLLVAATRPESLVNEVRGQLQNGQIRNGFYDVWDGDWFTPYTTVAATQGIVNGYPDGSFRPAQTINTAEGLKMVLEAYGVDVRRTRFQEKPLLYVNANDWFARYFVYAHNKNIINSYKFYHPAQPMTRGEFAEVLYRVKTLKESGASRFTDGRTPYSNEYTITIPKLNIIDLNVNFADPYNAQSALEVLKDGLGHYLSPPGSGQKMVIFGHSSGFNWDSSAYKQILRQINKLTVGDRIYINFQERGYVYEMQTHNIVPAAELNSVMTDYGYEEVALYTCWPPDSVAQRYIVHAARVY